MKIKCLGLCVLLAACGVPEGTGEPSAATPTTGDLVEYISTDAIFLLRIDLSRRSDLWGTVFPGKVIDGQVSERELGDIRGSGPVYRCDVNGIPCLSLGYGIEFTVPPADALEWQVSTMHDWSYRTFFWIESVASWLWRLQTRHSPRGDIAMAWSKGSA